MPAPDEGGALDVPSTGDAGGRWAAADAARMAAEALPVPFNLLHRDGRSLFTNQAYCDLIGLTAAEVLSRPPGEALHPADVAPALQALADAVAGGPQQVEVRLRHAAGHLLDAVWRLALDPVSGLVLAVIIDVSDERERTAALEHAASHDPLTDLANRLMVMASLRRWIREARQADHAVLVAQVDLDRFKLVNDRLGHQVGDGLLQVAARRLRERAPAGALVGRMGGDEFIVVVPVGHADGAPALAASLERITGDAHVHGIPVALKASIGVTAGTEDAEQLLHEADVAAYTAKAAGGNRAQVYDAPLQREDSRQRSLRRLVLEAIEDGEVGVVLQPLCTIGSDGACDRVVGLEALARLAHPTVGEVVAADFIGIARRLGLAGPVLRQVRDAAIGAVADLVEQAGAAAPDRAVALHLNVDSRDFADPRGLDDLLDLVDAHGLDPSRIVLELTEDILLEDLDATVAQLHAARARGARIAIDNFGVGSSSLSLLATLPVDLLKVDGSFLQAAHTSHNARTILTGLLRMAPDLAVDLILTGVQDAADLRLAHQLGGTVVQGFHVAMPLAPEDLPGLLGV